MRDRCGHKLMTTCLWMLYLCLLLWPMVAVAMPPSMGLEHDSSWEEQKAYSEFNHHLSGAFLLFMGGLLAVDAADLIRGRWMLLWPIALLLLGAFLVVWSDSEAWPVGPVGFFDALAEAETLQHKLYAVVLFALGFLEWARVKGRPLRWGSHVFFGILLFAGLLMFHHSLLMAHNHQSPKLLPNHLLIGALTIGAGGVKFAWERQWMKWRYGGQLWPGSVLLLGVLLVFYSE